MEIINMLSIEEATIIAEKILIKDTIDCDDNERIIIPSEYIIEHPALTIKSTKEYVFSDDITQDSTDYGGAFDLPFWSFNSKAAPG